jgi:hypothetical protein
VSDVDVRSAATDALHRYCRGIDRLDPALVASAFHPGAELIDYGPAPLSIETFVEHALASLGSRFVATQHRVSNISVERRADRAGEAVLEAYVLAFHVERHDDVHRLHTFAGRYIDRFELRDGDWRIARRTLRHDWSRIEQIDETMSGTWVASGRAGTPDPLDD